MAALVAMLCLLAGGPAVAVPLPYESNDSLGDLSLASGTVVFNTDDGTYSINGALQNSTSNRRAVAVEKNLLPDLGNSSLQPSSGSVFIAAYDFTNIDLGADVNVSASGISPLLLLASGFVSIDGTINLHGDAGQAGGAAGGGGGGAGGGAVGIFANGKISLTGVIDAHGGDAGTSESPGGGSGAAQGGVANAGGGGGGSGGVNFAGGTGGDGGTGVLIGLDTAWVKIGLRAGGGGGGGGGAYDGSEGSGASLGGGAGNPGAAGNCEQIRKGGDGGASTGSSNGFGTAGAGAVGNGLAGGSGAQTGFFASGSGGGGGGGGGAPAGGDGGRGGRGGHLGGGGGGGGGGGDVCSLGQTPGKGKDGGGGGGGGERGKPGSDGMVVTNTLRAAGGPGGGGYIVVSSRDSSADLFADFDVAGGTAYDGTIVSQFAAGGVLSIYGDYDATGGSLNGISLLGASADDGFYTSATGLSQSNFALLGGAGGGGAGGNGIAEPGTLLLFGFGLAAVGVGAARRKGVRAATARV